ncbi:phosphoglycolate phosphatase [Bdellovibrio bacteriovorus]|uniref:phosphoglycolate phosphatase n=1 Tax=Bdellovibrio bacteriovorus TaxID=959 RepID=A0A150WRT9_BDEBC|nr:HAD hydrolase-like protein [Bdellovibrio bacteriovorus]KYG67037.1 phosphoglycolate phosphatase [Bdellovibrio bacteriovorus]
MNPLLIFDLDGTLIDSAPDIVVAVNRTLVNHGKQRLKDDVIIAHIGEGLKKLIADIFMADNLSPAAIIELEMEFLRIYEEEMLNRTNIFPGVENFLATYEGPMGIVTNKNELPAKAILKHLGLDKYPWVEVFGADTLKERKPHPLPLQTMMKLAKKTEQETFMIGDGIPDVLSALRAGVRSIAIGFGYTATSLLNEHDPVAILRHYDDLPLILREQSQKTPRT